MNVPLAPSGLREQDIDAIVNVLKSGNLTMGKEVVAFEREMADYLGTKYFVMVNSGSSANLAIIEALLRPSRGEAVLKPGDGVLVPAIAWPTTVWPLIQLGLNPVFVDVDPQTLILDFSKAKELLGQEKNRIRAIFPIHPLGLGIEKNVIDRFCSDNAIVLINDVCESLGSWQDNFHSGTSGEMSSFSFYFSHHMTTMEGGGIATNNKIYFNDLKSIRSHGWSRDRDDVDDWSIEVHPSLRKFTFISSGYNIRPMEIQAAVGRHQLRDLESMIKRRREIAKYVLDSLRNSQFQVVGAPSSEEVLNFRRHSWMHIPIKINSVEANADRFKVVRYLEDSGIETQPPLTGNFIKQPAMSRFFSDAAISSIFPNADSIAESTFLVGCHHDLSDLQVEHLANKLVAASNINS